MRSRRTTKYTPRLGQLICNKMATSNSGLVKLCCQKGMPNYSTVFGWLTDPDKHDFLQAFLLACEAQADLLGDEIIQIADEAGEEDNTAKIARARLRIDARKWKAANRASKKYGDTQEMVKRNEEEEKGTVIIWGGKEIAL
jgi:hypothetical protein